MAKMDLVGHLSRIVLAGAAKIRHAAVLDEPSSVQGTSRPCCMHVQQRSRTLILPSLKCNCLCFLIAVATGPASDCVGRNVSWTRWAVCTAREFGCSCSRRHHRSATRRHSLRVARRGALGDNLRCRTTVRHVHISAHAGWLLGAYQPRSVAASSAHACIAPGLHLVSPGTLPARSATPAPRRTRSRGGTSTLFSRHRSQLDAPCAMAQLAANSTRHLPERLCLRIICTRAAVMDPAGVPARRVQ